MKRSSMRPKLPPRPDRSAEFASYAPRHQGASRAVMVANLDARMTVPVPKLAYVQHEGYMNIVRRMACAHCGRAAPSQFCHSDEGKGAMLKTDCRDGWPGCADGPGRIGCHTLIGSTGAFTRDQRRHLEASYAKATRAAVLATGQWPKDLPQPEDAD